MERSIFIRTRKFNFDENEFRVGRVPLSPVLGEFSFTDIFFDVVVVAVLPEVIVVLCDMVSDVVSSMTIVVVVSVLVEIADVVVTGSSLSGTNSKLFSLE